MTPVACGGVPKVRVEVEAGMLSTPWAFTDDLTQHVNIESEIP